MANPQVSKWLKGIQLQTLLFPPMYHIIIKFLQVTVLIFLPTLTYIYGNKFNISDGSLIFVNSESLFYYHDNLKFKDDDIVNDYLKYCDDYQYHSTGSGYSISDCICCTATMCLCDSLQSAIHHTKNNTVIAISNSVPMIH